jgi:hypothetical protein
LKIKNHYFVSTFLEAIQLKDLRNAVTLEDLMIQFYTTNDEKLIMQREEILKEIQAEPFEDIIKRLNKKCCSVNL